MTKRTINCSQDGGYFAGYSSNDGAGIEFVHEIADVGCDLDRAIAARSEFKRVYRAKGYESFRFEDPMGRLGPEE